MQDKGEEERTQGVALLDAGFAPKGVVPEEQERGLVITKSYPTKEVGEVLVDFCEHSGTVHRVEGVAEVHLQLNLTRVRAKLIEQQSSGVNRGLGSVRC